VGMGSACTLRRPAWVSRVRTKVSRAHVREGEGASEENTFVSNLKREGYGDEGEGARISKAHSWVLKMHARVSSACK
jgi:hypothetical protein